jgi:hypothetical protein
MELPITFNLQKLLYQLVLVAKHIRRLISLISWLFKNAVSIKATHHSMPGCLIKWEGFGRKWSSPNQGTIPEFVWRD